MKHIAAILAFISLFFQTEKYYVIYIKGSAHVATSGNSIKVGSVIQASDILVFDKPGAKMVCVSPQKGRFEVIPGKKRSAKGELLVVLKNNILPVVSHYHFSTRGVGFSGYDPATYFQSTETNNRILLISDEMLPISSTYKLDSTNFFFLQYAVEGKRVTKKIDQAAAGISFNLQTFSATSESELPATVSLCYQSTETGLGRSRVVAEFTPALLNKNEIKQQIQIIKKYTGTANQKNFRTELAAHLYDNYGKIGQEELTALSQ